MKMQGQVAVVSGGASGLGRATVSAFVDRGASVAVLDLADPTDVAGAYPPGAVTFLPTDVADEASVAKALAAASELGSIRALVHTAGIGGRLRFVDKSGAPGDPAIFERVLRVNLLGTFLMLSRTAALMAASDPIDGERGVIVLTSSIAAYEGQIGQAAYASAKGGVVGMTLPAARDLASRQIRVCAIAPGTFDTPLLGRLRPDIRAELEAQTPHPSRLGRVEEFASLALHIVENPMLNGEVIRLDGALRMPPR